MSARNPSPPPDISDELKQADHIGNSAYSKRWLIALLMDLLNLMNSKCKAIDATEELNPDIEQQLCCLWDLTVNHDVLPHLDEFSIVSIFTDVLVSQRYPRLMEICVGILANMAYDKNACQKMSDNETFISRTLALFYSRDTPTLTEVCRLVQTVLASDEQSAPWLTAIRFQSDFLDNIIFILQSSTNGHLLIATIRLLDAITRGDDSLAEVWCGPDLLDAVLVAQHQMKWLHGNEVEVIHRLFYTFSSNVTGVSALVKSFDNLLPTFATYLHKVCEDEPHLIPFSAYYNSLRALIPVMDSVVASLPVSRAASSFSSDSAVLVHLVHVTLGCQKQLRNFPLVRGILADLQIFFKDLIQAMEAALCSSSSDDLSTLDPMLLRTLQWFTILEQDDCVAYRDAFVSCCLNDNSIDTRNQLLFICNCLKLTKLLEALTDDC